MLYVCNNKVCELSLNWTEDRRQLLKKNFKGYHIHKRISFEITLSDQSFHSYCRIDKDKLRFSGKIFRFVSCL